MRFGTSNGICARTVPLALAALALMSCGFEQARQPLSGADAALAVYRIIDSCTAPPEDPYAIAETGLFANGWQPEARWIDHEGAKRKLEPSVAAALDEGDFETSVWQRLGSDVTLSLVRSPEFPGECSATIETENPEAVILGVAQRFGRPSDLAGRIGAGGDWLTPRQADRPEARIWHLPAHDVQLEFGERELVVRIIAMPDAIRDNPNSPFAPYAQPTVE